MLIKSVLVKLFFVHSKFPKKNSFRIWDNIYTEFDKTYAGMPMGKYCEQLLWDPSSRRLEEE